MQLFSAYINSRKLKQNKTKMTSLLKRLSLGVPGRYNYSCFEEKTRRVAVKSLIDSVGKLATALMQA